MPLLEGALLEYEVGGAALVPRQCKRLSGSAKPSSASPPLPPPVECGSCGGPGPGCAAGGCTHGYRPLSQVGSRRKRCPGQFGQDGMGSIPATPSTKHDEACLVLSTKQYACLY